MSFLDQSRWKAWASEWQFAHSPQSPFRYANEWIAGLRDQRLVRVAWGGSKGRRLFVTIRFPQVSSANALRENLRVSEDLAALPGWKKIKQLAVDPARPLPGAVPQAGAMYGRPDFSAFLISSDLLVDDTSVQWSHIFSWRRPKPAQVRAWVEQLLAGVARRTPAFDGQCEVCHVSRVSGFMLFEGMPMLMCPSCRERFNTEAKMAAHRYEQEEANYVLGLLLGMVAAIVGGSLWGLFAIWTGRLGGRACLVAAVGIGMLVAWCYKLGARKLDVRGQVLGAALTFVSVVIGDVIFFAWRIQRDQPEVGFRLDAGWWGFKEMLKRGSADTILSLVLAAVGAIVAVSMLRRPRFDPRIQAADDVGTAKKHIA